MTSCGKNGEHPFRDRQWVSNPFGWPGIVNDAVVECAWTVRAELLVWSVWACYRRLRRAGRSLARRHVPAAHRRRDDVLPGVRLVARLRRGRLRRRRQLVLVPRRAGDVRPRRAGAGDAADTAPARLLAAGVTSPAAR